MSIMDYEKLFENKNIGEVLFNEGMKNHTSFKIGGPADALIIPKDENQVLEAITLLRANNIDYFIMGNGTNLLVKDGGLRCVVIKINEGLNKVEIQGNKVYCQAGALLSAVSKVVARENLTGMEFSNGIPGTIGGAVTMNAGAYGGEMKDIITKVRIIDKENRIKEYSNSEMNFRYRGSRVTDEDLIVLSVELELKPGDPLEIDRIMKDLTYKRTSKQPLELPSGGSTFKRPVGYFAGKLIEDSGLRGLRHGGAQISEKHCGFVVNVEDASCKNVLELIQIVQKTVRDNYDVELETEIKLIGEDL
ncbi:MAG: UDP-N-acetylmuramate dehydrogenase [Tissierellia bacterium]|nr:UDP-N-acetylmuramate dehydrogenase [Tissierellia bacterium]